MLRVLKIIGLVLGSVFAFAMLLGLVIHVLDSDDSAAEQPTETFLATVRYVKNEDGGTVFYVQNIDRTAMAGLQLTVVAVLHNGKMASASDRYYPKRPIGRGNGVQVWLDLPVPLSRVSYFTYTVTRPDGAEWEGEQVVAR